MDSIIITAAVILSVIALIEVVTLFFTVPSGAAPLYVEVLPVFGEDEAFRDRLEHIRQRGCGRRRMILVDYSATEEQRELCRRFAEDEPDAVFLRQTELEKCLEGIFT